MRRIKRFISLLLAFCLVLSAIPTAAFAADETATVTVNVTYKQTEARSMLEMINDFRTGDDAWAWDSSDTEQVYYTGLSELTYDYDLEAAAMQRAAEIALSYSHTRPDGTSCFTAYSWSNCGENIAAGTSLDTAEEAFALWQETDKSYSGQGHRRNMLSASFTAVAVACVYYNGCYYWVQEFRRPASSQAATTVNDNATDVDVEIALSDATVSVTPSAASLSLTVGETTSLPALTIKLQMSGAWPSRSGPVSADAEWTVGDESCVTLSDDGTVTAEATGNTTLTATVLGEAVTVSVIVTEAVCEHTYDSGVVTAEPTCTAEGVKTYTCTQCGATYTEAVAALGHVYTATDNGDGTHTQACSRCSSKVTATHSYSVQQYNWAGDYSSCTADFACDECDAAETVECAVTGDVTTAPTCTTSGRATYTASASLGGTTASQKKAVTLAATGHTYVYADNGDGTHTVSCAQGDLTASNESCTYEGGVCVCCGAAEPESSTVVASGVCGDDLTWVLDEDGTLTISGTGDMTLFEENSAPWYAWREQIVAVVLESGVKSVGNYAFYGCTALKTVSLPNSVTCLCYSAFYGCTGLTKVVIPDSVTDIGDSAFFGCTNLADVTIGSSVTEIRAYVFAYTALSNVIIPEGVTDISEYAFHCAALTSVTIPESVISIGTGAFSYCVGLTDVYYAGSKADWAAISIGSYNTYLENATIHYTETTITELTAPTITSLYNATNGVSVGWDAVDGAASYIVWRLNSSTGKWEKCATTTETKYLSTSPVSGTTYYYAIEAVNGNVTSGRGTQRYILYMATPKVSLENTSTGVKVTWTSVSGVTTGYQVYRRTADTDYELLKAVSTSTTSYTDATAAAGVRYYYIVRSVRGSARSAYASQYITRLTAPTGISVSNVKNGVQVKWDAVTGATSYQVWRKLSGSSSWSKVGTTTGTTYVSTGVSSGNTYVFTVKAVYNSSVSAYNTTGKTIMRLSEPTITLENLAGGLTASWDAVDGAKGYKLYRRTETESYALIATLGAGTLTYTDRTAEVGVVYYYRVQAYNGSYTSSWTSQFYRRMGYPVLTLTRDSSGVVLSWTKCGGCTGYYIYRMNEDGSYTRIKTITSADTLTWTDTDVEAGCSYFYYVCGYNGSSLGPYLPKLVTF